tara:strand:+ start:11908 stop:13596 length:1689 start_codon:yes stop_codon:yes gene_type:complete
MRIYDFTDKLNNIPSDFIDSDIRFTNLILSYIHNLSYSNKAYFQQMINDKEFYINVSSNIMQKTHERYRVVLNYLIDNDYLHTDRIYIVGMKSIGFIINQNTEIHKGIKAISADKKYIDLLKKWNEWKKYKFNSLLKVDGNLHIANYYRKMINNDVFSFKKGMVLARRKLNHVKFQFLRTENKILKEELKHKYYSYKYSIENIYHRVDNITFDSQEARFFLPHTSLSNELFKYLTFKGDKLYVQIDIKNSQFQFLNSYLKKVHPHLFDRDLNDKDSDVSRLSDLIECGLLYDYFQQKLGLEHISRSQIKSSFFHYLYGGIDPAFMRNEIREIMGMEKKEVTKSIMTLMINEFPVYYSMIEQLKKGNYKEYGSSYKEVNIYRDGGKVMAQKLQLTESNVVKSILREVCIDNDIECFTKHDSFILPEDVEHLVIESIIVELRKVGIKMVDVEYQRDKLTKEELNIIGINYGVKRFVDRDNSDVIKSYVESDLMKPSSNSFSKGKGKLNKLMLELGIRKVSNLLMNLFIMSLDTKYLKNKKIKRPPDPPKAKLKIERISVEEFWE